MRRVALALLLAACGGARPPETRATSVVVPPAAPSTSASSAPAHTQTGWLLVYVNGSPLHACRPTQGTRGECTPLAAPRDFKILRKVDRALYLVERDDGSSTLWNALTGAITPIAAKGAEMRTRDGAFFRLVPRPTYTGIERAGDDGAYAKVPLWPAPGTRATDHAIAPSGAHLYLWSPGLGQYESPYFAGVIPGAPVTLYFAPQVGAHPRKIRTGETFFMPELADQDRLLAWWRPGTYDAKKNLRTLHLDVLDLATDALRTIDSVALPYEKKFANGAGVIERACPRTTAFPLSHYVFYECEEPSDRPSASKWRVRDLEGDETHDLPLRDDREVEEHVVGPVASGIGYDRQYANRVVVFARSPFPSEKKKVEVRMLAVPSLETLMVAEVPIGWVHGADWIE